MLTRRRRAEIAQEFADRRRKEDDAPRLQDEVPQLLNLALTIEERRPGLGSHGAAHIRRIVVDRAPALFVMRCTAPGCESGVHDFTHSVMRELRRGLTSFEGEAGCDGCACQLFHTAKAEYR
jgi:hypothetical protein